MSIEQVRSALSTLPRRSNGKIYQVPKTLRAEIMDLAKASPEPMYRFAKTIGVSPSVFGRWSREGNGVSKFRPVRVVSPVDEGSRWSLQGPSGTRISGMTIRELASLFRELEGR